MRNRNLVIILGLLGCFIAYLSFTGESTEGKDITFKALYAVSSTLIAFSFGGAAGLLFLTINTLSKKQKGIVGIHELSIKEEGIEEVSEFNTSLHKWTGMRGITELKKMYLLYVTESSAHVIPKDKARVEGDLDLFVLTVKENLKKSKKSALTTPR